MEGHFLADSGLMTVKRCLEKWDVRPPSLTAQKGFKKKIPVLCMIWGDAEPTMWVPCGGGDLGTGQLQQLNHAVALHRNSFGHLNIEHEGKQRADVCPRSSYQYSCSTKLLDNANTSWDENLLWTYHAMLGLTWSAVPQHCKPGCMVHVSGLHFPISSNFMRRNQSHMVILKADKTMSVCLGLTGSNIFLEH